MSHFKFYSAYLLDLFHKSPLFLPMKKNKVALNIDERSLVRLYE